MYAHDRGRLSIERILDTLSHMQLGHESPELRPLLSLAPFPGGMGTDSAILVVPEHLPATGPQDVHQLEI